MTYAEARAYIASLRPRGWRLGLDRMQELVRRAQLEDAIGPREPSFIHVTGTNGKGSVTATVQALLLEEGYRTGGFFSPFVYDFRERIQIGGDLVGEQDLADACEELRPAADSFDHDETLGAITEFEFKTALGFSLWKRHACDWVALEVGLGGRLDATNVVKPQACAIVSVGMDHMEFLGDTLAKIAAEKAGIVKPDAPCVCGIVPFAAQGPIADAASAADVDLWRVGHEIKVVPTGPTFSIVTPVGTFEGLDTALRGFWQPHNAAVAVGAVLAAGVPLSPERVRRALLHVRLPGRFERVDINGIEAVLDGGHNVDAAEAIALTFRQEFPGREAVLVWGMNHGHDPGEFLERLSLPIRAVHAAPLPYHRTYDPEVLAQVARGQGKDAHSHLSIADAVEAAARGADGAVVLVVGSFYLLADAKAALLSFGTGRPGSRP